MTLAATSPAFDTSSIRSPWAMARRRFSRNVLAVIGAFLLLLIILLSSCSPQRRLNRLLALHPELKTPDTLVLRDTIPIPQIQTDTILRISTLHDTVTLHKDHLQVKIHRLRDTIYIQSKTLPDTIFINRRIPVQLIKNIQPNTLDNFISKIPWLVIAFIFLVGFIIFLFIRFR